MDMGPYDQRETPSFSMDLFADRVNSILEAPLPKCLRLKGEDKYAHPMSSRVELLAHGAVSPRSTMIVSPAAVRVNSCGSQKGKPIHETLLEKGRLMSEKKETMRLQALEEEMRELRPAPNITHEAARRTPRREQRIEDRLLQRAKEAEERRVLEAKQREEAFSREMAAIAPFQPNITREGRHATPKARKMAQDPQEDWDCQRKQRREAARTAKLLEELNEVRGTPIINPRSEWLAARRRKKEGLSSLDVIDALMERDRIAQLRRWEQHELGKKTEHIPQITLYAATLQREGDAAERLYTESHKREERRLRKEEEWISDGPTSFTPRISPYAATTPRFRNVEDELMQKHMQSVALREEAWQREQEKELRRHQPMINPVSEAIASRLPESSYERLHRQSRRTPKHKDPAAADLSFTGSFVSGGRVASLPDSMAGSLRSYEESRREKLRKLQEKQEQMQREECTFAPLTNTRDSKVGGPEHVAARNQQWLARKEWKLRELRRRKEAEKVKECTFKPERETLMTSSSRDGESIYGGDGTPWGVQEYLERQEAARRLRREREMRLQQRPSSAPRLSSTTTPQEFDLGKRDGVSVRSLRRPPRVRLLSPDLDDDSRVSHPPEKRNGDALSVYERIYNRIYGTVVNGADHGDVGSDGAGGSLCVAPSLYR
ncbi:hypothetical protein TraAM80_01686 [Trypanosoma rangeli]|uniref:Uncharacterized protein n=1 Tax=Trypanosoma rangeli TaxID=5698 RepID=A0A3R7MS13_TRYRA|nr:uncharacterized protein TraAM80_01686 [Trypanosoma rangeli]RNF10327.1 hypothetical protein TraAM80_01686 [Trypanosoma rangeli]|eukprot:RNF10327.1 hypothetical protein TraAM80_01686 [Trypanosoma rangeli]